MAQYIYQDKVVSVQLLRALASIYVSVHHLVWAFANNVGDGFAVAGGNKQLSQMAVCVFFVISGYIMVVSSKSLFAMPGGLRVFWIRRAVRILPPYWIASALLLFWLATLQRTPELGLVLKSLVFWPFWDAGGSLRYTPFLWPGWTLFYELFFYFLFGLFLARGRLGTVVWTSAVLIILSVVSIFVEPQSAFVYFITRPILLTFVFGMAVALWRERGGQAPVLVRLAALVASGALLIGVEVPADPSANDFTYLLWASFPACLMTFAVLAGPLSVPMPRFVNAMGDMSYALYLLHVPMGWAWVRMYRHVVHPAEAWGFLITLLIATFIASWLFYAYIERPMTRWLNARLLPAGLPQTRP